MARNVTLSSLRDDIANQVDVTVGASGRYTPTYLTRLINQSIQRFRERVSSEGMAHFLVSATGTLTAGATSPYSFCELDLTSVSPSIVRTYGVDITVNGCIVSLAHRPFTERNDHGGPQNTGIPRAWMHYQTRRLAIAPAPDSAYAYAVWYLPVLADLSADGDTFDGVAGWEDYVVWDVCLRLITRDQYATAHALFTQNLERTWQDILRGASKVTAAGGANVGRDTFGGYGSPYARGQRGLVAAGGGTPATHSVTNAMLAEIPAETIKGRARGAGYGDVQNLTPGQAAGAISVFSGFAAGLVPTGIGQTTTFLRNDGAWVTPSVGGTVSGLELSQIQNIASPRVLGRFTVGTGAAEQVTGQQVASMIGLFTGAAHGLVPRPTGGAAGLFLKDDATWAAPAGGGGGPTMLAAAPAQAVQYNGGSGFAGASGFLFHVASGVDLHGRLHMPTGVIRLGDHRGSEPGGVSSGMIKFLPSMVDVIVGISSAGANAQLMQWAVDGPDIETLGRNIAVDKLFHRSATEHRWFVAGANKAAIDAQQFALPPPVVLGVGQLAHSLVTDKLGAWTPSGFATVATGIYIGASGCSIGVGSGGPQLSASGISLPTGSLRFGASGVASKGDVRGPHRFEVWTRSADGSTDLPVARMGAATNNRLTVGGGTEGVAGLDLEATSGHVRSRIADATKVSVTDSHQLHEPGIGLALRQLSHSAATDKLATWTASGFANVATGITLGASGYSLSVGSGGPVLHASGADFRSSTIENIKRINGLDGIKVYGFVSGGGAASGSQVINVQSGTAFVIPETVTAGQIFNLVPSGAVHGDMATLENRSGISHWVNNSGTGMSTPSGFIATISPSGGTSYRFASGAWGLVNRYQYG
jgi:hypothetical protein